MATPSGGEDVKAVAHLGGGPPPGYQWNVVVLDRAFEEATAFLDEDQYAHMAAQVGELARQPDPTHSLTVDVRQIDEFWEVRDKGGVLRRLNVRVFYCVCAPKRTLAVIGAINKKNDGATPSHVKTLMRYRVRRYLDEHCKDSA